MLKKTILYLIKEKLISHLIIFIVFVLGIISFLNIQRDIFPDVNFQTTSVTAGLPGSSAEEIEKLILQPIESAIRQVYGIKNIQSVAYENMSMTMIELDKEARNPDETNRDIETYIEQIKDFPEDVILPQVKRLTTSERPLIHLVLSGEVSEEKLQDYLDYLYEEVTLIPGIASVTKQGERFKEFLIETDTKKLSEKNLSLTFLINYIKSQNVSLPAGNVRDHRNRIFPARTNNEFSTKEALASAYVMANDSGFGTQIKDIASVTEQLEKKQFSYLYNGKPAVKIMVAKSKNADALELVKKIKKKSKDFLSQFKEAVFLDFSNDVSVFLKNRLGVLSSNLILGLILILILLSIFIPWQMVLVVALGIPLSLLCSVTVLSFTSFSINLISLLGFIIVSGMLVDDAIVVCENIWRHLENKKENESVKDKVVEAVSEVAYPIIGSITTTILTFTPMLFMKGIMGDFVFSIPIVIIISLIFSILEAFFVMPAHVVHWSYPLMKYKIKASFKWVKSVKDFLNTAFNRYIEFLKWSLAHRYWMLLAVFVLFISVSVLTYFKGSFLLFSEKGLDSFKIVISLPSSTPLDETEKALKDIHKNISLLPKSEVVDYYTSVGISQEDVRSMARTKIGTEFATIRVGLTPFIGRARSVSDIIKDLKNKNKNIDPKINISYSVTPPGPPRGYPISLFVKGDDIDSLKNISKKIKHEMKKIDGVIDVSDSLEKASEEYHILPRFKEMISSGLTAMDIAITARAAFDGIAASYIQDLQEKINIRVQLKNEIADPLEQLNSLKIQNRKGYLVNLKDVADFKKGKTLRSVKHLDFKRTVNISARIDLDKITPLAANKKIQPFVDQIVNGYPGYSWNSLGEDKDSRESLSLLFRTFIFAILFIMFFLVILFKSLKQCLLIITSIPLSFIGVSVGMILRGENFGFMSLLGMAALAGVIVNNTIIFMSFVNKARQKIKDLNESIIEVAQIRTRPILLTAMTTVLGMIPTAYGDWIYKVIPLGGVDHFVSPIALSLVWGIAFGSVLILIFFPSFIRCIDDISFNLFKK